MLSQSWGERELALPPRLGHIVLHSLARLWPWAEVTTEPFLATMGQW